MAYKTQNEAKVAATMLLDQLGSNWSTRIWQNWGWYCEAYRTVDSQEVQVWATEPGSYCALASKLCLSHVASTPLDALHGLREMMLQAAEDATLQAAKLKALYERL